MTDTRTETRTAETRTTETKIRLEGLSKSFEMAGGRSLEVLRDISFEVRDGDFVAVLGPSGSGKSTLLGILSGIQEHDAGTLEVPPPEEIGYVFQKARLLPWRTVDQNLETTRRARARHRSESFRHPVAHYLDAAGLSEYGGFYPAALSGGMQQRVSIARALATEPQMLLMDEPFSALDEMTARKQRNFLRRLWQTNRPTILFVTHNVIEAVTLATSIIVVSERPGRVLDHIEVDASYPRDLSDPAVASVYHKVLSLLGVGEEDRGEY